MDPKVAFVKCNKKRVELVERVASRRRRTGFSLADVAGHSHRNADGQVIRGHAERPASIGEIAELVVDFHFPLVEVAVDIDDITSFHNEMSVRRPKVTTERNNM
ncbi:MAG: hypothetical protein FWD69_10300 [Polyangiaceae bacterium]|nr:hypothetical protein [Polyangiaceae bacterium]